MTTTLLSACRFGVSTLLLCALSGAGTSLFSQSRDFNVQRLLLDDNADDGTRNTLTLQVPGAGLSANRTITFPDSDGTVLTVGAGTVTPDQILFGGSDGQAAQSPNLLWTNATNSLSVTGTVSATSSGTASAGVFSVSSGNSSAYALHVTSQASNDALHVDHSGSLGSAGQFLTLNSANARDALHVETAGLGSAGDFSATNSANTANALNVRTSGTGDAVNAVNSGTTGHAGDFRITNGSNAGAALQALTGGTGDALNARNTGVAGSAARFRVSNAANSSIALDVLTNGVGSAGRFRVLNTSGSGPALIATTNVEEGLALFTEGSVEVSNGNLSITNTSARPGELRLYESADAGGAYTAFVAQTQSGNITYALPGALPSVNGSVLASTTTGTMSWVNPAGTSWQLTGNAISAGQVLGTTNAQDLNIVAGNSTRITIDDVTGNVGIGGAFSGTDRLTVTGSAAVTGDVVLGDDVSDDVIVNGTLDVTASGNEIGDGTDAEQLRVQGVDGGAVEVDINGDADVSGTLGAGSTLINGASAVTNSRLVVDDGHWTSQQTSAPTAAATGANVATAVLTNETDVAGFIDITASGTPLAGAQATVTFNTAYGTAPIVGLTPANGPAAGIGAYVTRTTTGFTINFIGVPAASTSYQFFYQVIETQ